MRILSRLLLALLLSVSLAGCVWLRMLEMKSQMNHFDENFRVESDRHLTLHFLHPLLYSDDYLTLAKVQPSLKETAQEGKRWRQIFRKVDAAGQVQAGSEIVFTLQFNREDRLASWDFSEGFMAMIPSRFLEASLRSLGKGKVDESRKQLRVHPDDLPKVDTPPPSRKEILASLGEPAEKTEENGFKLHVYRFQTDTLYTEPDYEDRRNASAKLFYDPKTDELQKVTARFLGLKFSVDFRKFIQLEAVGKGKSA